MHMSVTHIVQFPALWYLLANREVLSRRSRREGQVSGKIKPPINWPTAVLLALVPQVITQTHLHPSLSTILTFPSHPPTAIQRPPGAQARARRPRPGVSFGAREKAGDEGLKWVRWGPIAEWIWREYFLEINGVGSCRWIWPTDRGESHAAIYLPQGLHETPCTSTVRRGKCCLKFSYCLFERDRLSLPSEDCSHQGCHTLLYIPFQDVFRLLQGTESPVNTYILGRL